VSTEKLLIKCGWNWHLWPISSTFYALLTCFVQLFSSYVLAKKHFCTKKRARKMWVKLTPGYCHCAQKLKSNFRWAQPVSWIQINAYYSYTGFLCFFPHFIWVLYRTICSLSHFAVYEFIIKNENDETAKNESYLCPKILKICPLLCGKTWFKNFPSKNVFIFISFLF